MKAGKPPKLITAIEDKLSGETHFGALKAPKAATTGN